MSKDIIVVIDGGIKEDSTLTTISSERVAKAAELYKEGCANKIVMSGGGRGPATALPAVKTEAQAMKEYAIALGIPPEAIFLEEQSKDVLGNAYFSRVSYLEPSGWANIAVITSDYSALRAEYVFHKILGPAYVMEFVQAAHTPTREEIGQRMMQEARKFDLAREWLGSINDGDLAALEEFIYHWHPLYTEPKKISNTQIIDRAKEY